MEAGQATITTAEDRARFERDGYLVVADSGIDEATIDGAVADTKDLYEPEEFAERWGTVEAGDIGVFYTSHRLMDAWRISENVKKIATAPRLLQIIEELYGRKPLPFQTLTFPFGTQQKAHSDTIHFDSEPPDYMLGVWVALEDMDMTNGPIYYYPGSQKLPRVNMQTVGADADPSQYPHYERYIEKLIEREGLKREYALIKKGQAFLWSANILHGGAPRKDMSRSRQSQVTHVFFENCRYYMPLMSKDPGSEDGTRWLNPDWIQ